MPFPVAAVAIGAVARGVAGVAVRGAARGVMTGARFGARSATRMSGRAALLGSNISSAQFSSQSQATPVQGNAITEPLRFGADMRVGTEK